ncbi:MAG TPA: rhomboid family intramembrane serine protease [Deltaproteobacteria bacterium]|nr:rhomboid family intramembrane serine protease [Deltaproteobacteria bacterium]
MIFPIGDTPNPDRIAWANTLLILVNVLVYLLITLPLSLEPLDPGQLGTLTEIFGDVPRGAVSAYDGWLLEHGYQTAAPEASDLLASMFLHAGLGHLGSNMWFLWIYGDNVEARLGSIPYLLLYLLFGVAATLAYGLVVPASPIPLVGASGAISGVLGAYLVWFPHNRVRLLVALWPLWVDVVLVPAWAVLGAYLTIDNLLPLFLGSASGVAYGAHVGGFFAGILVALGLGGWGARATARVDHLEAGRRALDAGDQAAAFHHLVTAYRRGDDATAEAARRELLRIPDPRLQAWLRGRLRR